jgi:hypothetical protein
MYLFHRSSLIPGIVIFLQKLLRGALARKLYKRMVAARYCSEEGLWIHRVPESLSLRRNWVPPASEFVSPLGPIGWSSNIRLRVRGCGDPILKTLDKKPGTLYTLCSIVSNIFHITGPLVERFTEVALDS